MRKNKRIRTNAIPDEEGYLVIKRIVIYPFLFALFPILALYAHNMGELYVSSIWIPLGLSLGLAILLFVLAWAIFRNSLKAGLITAVLITIFFADGHISKLLIDRGFSNVAMYLAIVWGICFIVIIYFVARTKRKLANTTTILNVIGVALIVITFINIIVNEVTSPGVQTQNTAGSIANPGNTSALPDIYYIILDGYSGASTLKNFYGYDNSGFADYLGEKGFYVATNTNSNYSYTFASLASSLNMEYINYVSDQVGNESKDLKPLTEMVENSRVLNLLKSMGYYSIQVDSPDEPTAYNKYVDLNIKVSEAPTLGWGSSTFETMLIKTTLLNRFWDITTPLYRSATLNAFDKLAETPDMKGPKFIFAHILCPHWPFVFDADGNVVKATSWLEDPPPSQRQKYLGQIQFINGKVETLVDDILSRSETPPIIILQGDHGSRLCWDKSFTHSQYMQDTFRILNAYYLPNGDESILYKGISPVNSFRVIFNSYFATNYDILDDECYYSNAFSYPYAFVNVTSEVIHN
jgi:hypothetical protein